MPTKIATERLKSGEPMTIEVVTPPDAERDHQILPFLQHKPQPYFAHIKLAAAGKCDALETRYYLGMIGDQLVGNIMTVESLGVGIFGHVYTHPDHRRKGVCAAIMQHQMQDFRRRDGSVLLLGTGYQSTAYHIYHHFGFRDWPVGDRGLMRYDNPASPAFETEFFAAPPYRVAEAEWRHWPLVALLAAVPGERQLRSLALPAWGVSLQEGTYAGFMADHQRSDDSSALVLEASTGAVMAFASLIPDARWRRQVLLLDLFAHPNLSGPDLNQLVQAMLPTATDDRRIQCYADPDDAAKIAAITQTGFRREAVLSKQFKVNSEWRDVLLFGR